MWLATFSIAFNASVRFKNFMHSYVINFYFLNVVILNWIPFEAHKMMLPSQGLVNWILALYQYFLIATVEEIISGQSKWKMLMWYLKWLERLQ